MLGLAVVASQDAVDGVEDAKLVAGAGWMAQNAAVTTAAAARSRCDATVDLESMRVAG